VPLACSPRLQKRGGGVGVERWEWGRLHPNHAFTYVRPKTCRQQAHTPKQAPALANVCYHVRFARAPLATCWDSVAWLRIVALDDVPPNDRPTRPAPPVPPCLDSDINSNVNTPLTPARSTAIVTTP
jgi:hypothetical protein